MKLIDVERKGNLLRLYCGEDDCLDYWGDDWNDIPYEYNAGTVYPWFVSKIIDFCVDFPLDVCEPKDLYLNSPFSKEDMKNGKVEIVSIRGNDYYAPRTHIPIFLETPIDTLLTKIEPYGTMM